MKILYLSLLYLIANNPSFAQHLPVFDIQGHQGGRGPMPENTIPAFIATLDMQVTTVGMSVFVTRDKQVILSLEPWISAQTCLNPSGEPIAAEQEKNIDLYKMTYAQIRQCDCRTEENTTLPKQQKTYFFKPLLRDVIVAIEDHIKNVTQYEVDYNIQIQTMPEEHARYHPPPEEFSDIIYHLVDQYIPMTRVVVQSFDTEVLRYWNKTYPDVRLSLLTKETHSIEEALEKLTFNPSVCSPHYQSLNASDVITLHERGIRVIPWTVNHVSDMLILKGMGADGFITDYPDSAFLFHNTLTLNSTQIK